MFFSFQCNELYWPFWVYLDINLKLLSGKNTQKVNKQNIWDSYNWMCEFIINIKHQKIFERLFIESFGSIELNNVHQIVFQYFV